jgi:hypothetical protein
LQAVIPPSLKRAKVMARPTGMLRISDPALRDGGVGSEAYAAIQ